MKILGIDTAIPSASVAIVADGILIAEKRHSPGERQSGSIFGANHAEILLPLIDAVLECAATSLQQVSGIAVSVGPGSFTGLRIGVASAKGLAYQSGLPIAGISTLEANAACAGDFVGTVASMLDARKGDVYLAFFRNRDDRLSRVTTDRLLPLESAVEWLCDFCATEREPMLLLGDGAILHERALRGALGPRFEIALATVYPTIAAQVARLGETRLRAGCADDPGALTPIYVQLAHAERRSLKSAKLSDSYRANYVDKGIPVR